MRKIETVGVNEFVRRQVKSSGKTYSPTLIFEDVAAHAEEQMSAGYFREGYREGVRIVSADKEMSKHFVCPFVRINESSKLKAEVVRRRPEEEPYIQVRAVEGDPLPTGKVELILYRRDVLVENNEQTSEKDWELISIHALPEDVDQLPMGSVTMMRNQLELPGGTKASYTSDDWAEAVRFWQRYAAVGKKAGKKIVE